MVDTVNTFEEQKPEDQAYVKEMTDKVDQVSADASEESRPEWLPEKFKSAEDMAKAYSELEKKMSQPEETQEQEEVSQSSDEAREYLSDNGLDYDALASEFQVNGGLSDEAYDALEKAGIPASLVDQYIDGQMAISNQMRSQAFESVGGEQAYMDMVEWASSNWSSERVDAYNKAVDSGDMNAVQLAVSGLAAEYRSENGSEPRLVSGDTASVSSGAFGSVAELTQAMADPRYQKDPAYRAQVASKLKRSSVL
jgi:hypothetical protein